MLATRTHLNPAVEVALHTPTPAAGSPATGAPEGAGVPELGQPDLHSAKTNALAIHLPETVPGLEPLAQPESFTPATLSDKIDGKAELYLAAGFAAMACRSYQAGTARVEAYLYRMKSADAAFAVFSGQRRPGAAQSALAKNAYLTENALFLTSGQDYLEVIADRAGVKAQLETLASAVLAGLGVPTVRVKATAVPDLFPTDGLRADSVRLAVADAFGCQGLTNIYTAEYTGGLTAFLTRRKNAAEVQTQLELYRRFLADNGYSLQATPAGAPAGALILALEGSVEVLLVRGNYLAGAHDVPTQAAALKLAAQLDAALTQKGQEQ